MSAYKEKSTWEIYLEETEPLFQTGEVCLGPVTSYELIHDPKHMAFHLSRYKFCAKMLESKQIILEAGCGDGFGTPIIAQTAERVHCVDIDDRHIKGNARRLSHLKDQIGYEHLDLTKSVPNIRADGGFSLDVIEHIKSEDEDKFMKNIVSCLTDDAVFIVGTPNITAEQYASKHNRKQHINLKSYETLRQTMRKYFVNVFMFGMNDEVVHSGYPPMCHYLFAVGSVLKK